MIQRHIRYCLCLLAALMVACTSCGANLEHHCRSCHSAQTQHKHDCCPADGHCQHCWFYHADSVPSTTTQHIDVPQPAVSDSLTASPIQHFLHQYLTNLPQEAHTGTPPQLKQKGRTLLQRIHILIL